VLGQGLSGTVAAHPGTERVTGIRTKRVVGSKANMNMPKLSQHDPNQDFWVIFGFLWAIFGSGGVLK